MSKKEDLLSWERVGSSPNRGSNPVISLPTSEKFIEPTISTWTVTGNEPGTPPVTIRQVSSGFGTHKPRAVLSSQGKAA